MVEQFQDRDLIQDVDGSIFEVVGNTHHPNSVFSIPLLIDQNQIRSNKLSLSVSSFFQPNGIRNHEFSRESPIFNTTVFQIPIKKIDFHWKPQKILSSWFSLLKNQKFTVSPSLSKRRSNVIESALRISDEFGIPFTNMGVIGFDIISDQNPFDLIELNIYGIDFAERIRSHYNELRAQSKKLKPWLKIELLPLAEIMAQEFQLPLEDCFEILYYQPIRFTYHQNQIQLNFVPEQHEMINCPLYTVNSRIKSIGRCRIKATVKNITWGDFFPGLVELEKVEMVTDYNHININPLKLTRLLVFNRLFLNFFKLGQSIEIDGIVQEANHVFCIKSPDLINTWQIIIGSSDSFTQCEYVRNIYLEK